MCDEVEEALDYKPPLLCPGCGACVRPIHLFNGQSYEGAYCPKCRHKIEPAPAGRIVTVEETLGLGIEPIGHCARCGRLSPGKMCEDCMLETLREVVEGESDGC